MRVLHVLEAVEGGTALHVRHLATLQSARHEVAVAIPTRRSAGRTDAAIVGDLRSAGVHVLPLGMRRNPGHPANVRAAASLVRFIRAWRPDIVHAHSTIGGLIGRLAGAISRVPVVHTQNGAVFADAQLRPAAVAGRVLETLQRRATAALIAVSESEATALRSVHATGLVVVPNGIPVRHEPAAPMPELPTVVSVGRFVFQKEPLLAVRVMAEARRLAPDIRAVLVGYGALEEDVRRLIAELDPAIEVHSDLAGVEAIEQATVLLLTSRFEGAPYVLLEAMERSRPVVATDVVGSRDAVVHGVTGVLFPFGDVAAGAAGLAHLLTDPVEAARMGAAGRRRLEERFTVEAMVAGVDEVYDAVLARTSRAGRS